MNDNARDEGVQQYNINMFLQDDALTERICSDLEQLKYAQILTSLAMGPLFGDSVDGVFQTQPENTTRSLTKSPDEGRNDAVSRRHKRRVKPTPKVQEWNQARPLEAKRNTRGKRGTDEDKRQWTTKDCENENTVVAGELKWVNYGTLEDKEGSKGIREPDSPEEKMVSPVTTTVS